MIAVVLTDLDFLTRVCLNIRTVSVQFAEPDDISDSYITSGTIVYDCCFCTCVCVCYKATKASQRRVWNCRQCTAHNWSLLLQFAVVLRPSVFVPSYVASVFYLFLSSSFTAGKFWKVLDNSQHCRIAKFWWCNFDSVWFCSGPPVACESSLLFWCSVMFGCS